MYRLSRSTCAGCDPQFEMQMNKWILTFHRVFRS